MATSPAKAAAFELTSALLNTLDINEKINQYLLDNLPPDAWRVDPPNKKGRPIAAIVAHIHNVRVMWLKVSAKGSKIPAQLDRGKVTIAGAKKGLADSHTALRALIESALRSDGRIKGFKPDAAGFIGYVMAHDAHHRGQIAMLARQTGHPLPLPAQIGMWEWGKRGGS